MARHGYVVIGYRVPYYLLEAPMIYNTENLRARRLEIANLARLREREAARSYREHLAMMELDEPIWRVIAAADRGIEA